MREAPLMRAKGTGQVVAVAVGNTVSAATLGDYDQNQDIRGVRLVSTVDCWYEVGRAPVAAANTSTFLPAFQVEYASANNEDKVAVIRNAGDGSLYVRPLA